MSKAREHLREDHVNLNRLLERLSDAVDGANAPTIQQIWTEFETLLLRHFVSEERDLFPLVPHSQKEEVRRFYSEHEEIRRAVSELGVQCDLHAVRKPVIEQLLAKLKQHAEAEDLTVYRVLDDLTEPPVAVH